MQPDRTWQREAQSTEKRSRWHSPSGRPSSPAPHLRRAVAQPNGPGQSSGAGARRSEPCDRPVRAAERGKAAPVQATRRWPVERTHAWGNQFKKLVWNTERGGRSSTRSSPWPHDHHAAPADPLRLDPVPLGAPISTTPLNRRPRPCQLCMPIRCRPCSSGDTENCWTAKPAGHDPAHEQRGSAVPIPGGST
jgi:hypothetical protein